MGGSNRMLDPGSVSISAPYFISGRSGVLTGLSAGNPVARLVQFGMLDPRTPGAIVLTPIQISQLRLIYVPVTAPSAGVVFEVLKGTSTAQADTGGAAHLPQKRKTSGYPAIGATETSLYVAATGAISGGNFTASDASGPIDAAGAGVTDIASDRAIWKPGDLCPVQLEAGEALEVRAAVFGGTGVLIFAADFLR